MRTKKVTTIGFILGWGGAIFLFAEESPQRAHGGLDRYEEMAHYGKLVMISVEAAPSCYVVGYVYKCSPLGWQLMRGNLNVMNAFLKNELSDKASASLFLNKYFCNFMIFNMQNKGSFPVTAESIKAGEGLDPFPGPPLANNVRETLKRKLEMYAFSDSPMLGNDKWHLNVNILTEDGAVQHWEIEGLIFPLQIKLFKRELVEPKQTFSPVAVTM
jgi:hypothetical protein